jgi:hypothetical protein
MRRCLMGTGVLISQAENPYGRERGELARGTARRYTTVIDESLPPADLSPLMTALAQVVVEVSVIAARAEKQDLQPEHGTC